MQDIIKTVTPDADIPEQARTQMIELIETKYVSTVGSQLSCTAVKQDSCLDQIFCQNIYMYHLM